MKFLLAGFLFFICFTCRAQTIEIGYSPISFTGIGSLPETTKFNVSFLYPLLQAKRFHYLPGVRYSHVNSKDAEIKDKAGQHVDGKFNIISLLPASFNVVWGRFIFVNRMGLGVSRHSFPNDNGRYQNFVLEAGFSYSVSANFSVSTRYSHISNGGRGKINIGLDSIIFTTGFTF